MSGNNALFQRGSLYGTPFGTNTMFQPSSIYGMPSGASGQSPQTGYGSYRPFYGGYQPSYGGYQPFNPYSGYWNRTAYQMANLPSYHIPRVGGYFTPSPTTPGHPGYIGGTSGLVNKSKDLLYG